MRPHDLKLINIIQDWIAIWPMLILSMIVGGMLGLVFSLSRPPIYEASAYLQVSVDRNRALIPDDYTLLRAFEKVRLVFLADETLSEVLKRYAASRDTGIPIQDVADLRSSIRLNHREEGFQIFVYADSPEKASDLANLWGEVALTEIREATRHALRAGEYQSALYGTWCEIASKDLDSPSQFIWICKYGEGQIDPDKLEEGILEEVQKSRGILPVFSFSWIEKSSPPKKPIAWVSGWFVYCGALIGLLLTSILQVIRKQNLGRKP